MFDAHHTAPNMGLSLAPNLNQQRRSTHCLRRVILTRSPYAVIPTHFPSAVILPHSPYAVILSEAQNLRSCSWSSTPLSKLTVRFD